MQHIVATGAVLALLALIFMIGRRFVRRRFDVMFLSLLLFAYWFAFRPAQFALGLDTPFPDYLFPGGHLELVLTAELAAGAWLICFALGALSADLAGWPARVLLPRMPAEPNPFLTLAILLAFSAASAAVTAWLLISAGGALSDSIRYVKFERALVGLYFLRQFSAIGITLAIFTLYYFLYLQRVRGIDLPRWQVLAAAACIGVNAFGIYAWGQRYGVAMAFVGLVVGYHYFVARLSLLRLAVLGGLFLALFLGLRVIRDTLVFPEGVISPLEGANIWRQTAIAMHGSQFDAFLLVLRDFDLEAGLRWGEDFWAGLAALAPRALWPDRPPFNPGAWFRQLYEPETQNGWPVTPIGEWLINFGWIGVAVGGAISGYLTRAAQQVYDDLWKNPWSMMMSFVVALFVIPGGVNSGTPQSFMLMILPLGVVALTLKLLTPARMRWNEAVHGY